MNASNLSHGVLAMAMQFVIGCVAVVASAHPLTAAILGGLFAVGFYFGREVAQAERKAGTPPWWSGFIMTKWSRDAIFDLLCPAVMCAGLVLFVAALEP